MEGDESVAVWLCAHRHIVRMEHLGYNLIQGEIDEGRLLD